MAEVGIFQSKILPSRPRKTWCHSIISRHQKFLKINPRIIPDTGDTFLSEFFLNPRSQTMSNSTSPPNTALYHNTSNFFQGAKFSKHRAVQKKTHLSTQGELFPCEWQSETCTTEQTPEARLMSKSKDGRWESIYSLVRKSIPPWRMVLHYYVKFKAKFQTLQPTAQNLKSRKIFLQLSACYTFSSANSDHCYNNWRPNSQELRWDKTFVSASKVLPHRALQTKWINTEDSIKDAIHL